MAVAVLDHIDARLTELESLDEHWLDGVGLAPDRNVTGRARELAVRLLQAGFPEPAIDPTETGGVVLSGQSKKRFYEVSVDRSGRFVAQTHCATTTFAPDVDFIVAMLVVDWRPKRWAA